MRQKHTRQMSLFPVTARHDIGKELKEISEVLDATPHMLDLVYNDLIRDRRHETGREGMTAEQVLRACVLKQMRCLSYEELAFHLEDSNSFRAFARLEMGQYPSSSTLQENIKTVSEEAWEAIHICLMRFAQKLGPENGRKVRIDSTAIETDVHDPTDASLLWDGLRIITRYLEDGYLHSQARLRPGPLQLEELGRLQALSLEFDLRLQPPGDCQVKVGSSQNRSLTRSRTRIITIHGSCTYKK